MPRGDALIDFKRVLKTVSGHQYFRYYGVWIPPNNRNFNEVPNVYAVVYQPAQGSSRLTRGLSYLYSWKLYAYVYGAGKIDKMGKKVTRHHTTQQPPQKRVAFCVAQISHNLSHPATLGETGSSGMGWDGVSVRQLISRVLCQGEKMCTWPLAMMKYTLIYEDLCLL